MVLGLDHMGHMISLASSAVEILVDILCEMDKILPELPPVLKV